MNNYIPNMYYKSILDINYDLLKSKGINYLLIDFDNTIAKISTKSIPTEYINKLQKLKQTFEIIVISNNFSSKIKEQCSNVGIYSISFAIKPLPFCYKRVMKKYRCSKTEMCMIGDQIMTDILGANKFGIYSVLVDPLDSEEHKITKLNRHIEIRILNKLSQLNILKRGKYYE